MMSIRLVFSRVNQLRMVHGCNSVSRIPHSRLYSTTVKNKPLDDESSNQTLGRTFAEVGEENTNLPSIPQTAGSPDIAIYNQIIQSASRRDPAKLDVDTTEKDAVSLTSDDELLYLRRKLPSRSSTLVPYVNHSEVLSQLVRLGVNLAAVEKFPEVSNHLIKGDFEKDVKPYIQFLHDIGVEEIGTCLTNCPRLFMESIDDLKVRINYLEYKKFKRGDIKKIMNKAPSVFLFTTEELDSKLGFFQKSFGLKGHEVRQAVVRGPKILKYQREVEKNKFYLGNFLKFDAAEQKRILVICPQVYHINVEGILQRFEMIHDDLGLPDPHNAVLKYPPVLTKSRMIIRERHRFLVHLGRNQYDPTLENYVSLEALSTGIDSEFCKNVAKVPVNQFNDFLKTQ